MFHIICWVIGLVTLGFYSLPAAACYLAGSALAVNVTSNWGQNPDESKV